MTFSNYFRGVQSYNEAIESVVFLMQTNPNVALLFINRILWRYIEDVGEPNYCITEKFPLSWTLSEGGVLTGL